MATIKNSVGSKMFRNLWAKVNGQKKDITKNGRLSCALFASSVLYLFKLVKDIHATVDGTIRDLKDSGWKEARTPKAGCVLVWAEKDFKDGSRHRHIGFYLGNNLAVSNNSKKGYPTRHPSSKYDGRKIELIFCHPKLK